MPLIAKKIYDRALSNISAWGDTDVFPFPIENHVLHDNPQSVRSVLEQIEVNFDTEISVHPPQNYSTLAPVGYTGFRWATQIDPVWNAYLLSLVLSMAPDIEAARLPEAAERVFSYRYSPTGEKDLFQSNGWHGFQEATRERAERSRYVVAIDIADFYSRIYHHRLENALKRVEPGGGRTKQIMAILSKLSNNTSYGLPVGGPAARILAELVLNPVDRLLQTETSIRDFCRFADDYRFFVDDLQAAYRAIGFLSEKLLRNEGLSLQKSKTRVMTAAEYLSVLDPPNPLPGSAAHFLGIHIHFDPYSATPEEDYDRLKGQISQFDVLGLISAELGKGRIHAAVTRRLMAALQFMDETPRQQAILSLFENVETLAPVFPQLMIAARRLLDDTEDLAFVEQVHRKLRSLIESSHYVASIDLNLAYMLRVLASHRSSENEQLLIRIYGAAHSFGSGSSPTIQRDITLIMARWGIEYWLSDQKNYVSSAHPWVRRAFIVASYVLGDEGNHWRRANRSSFLKFEVVVADWASQKAQSKDWRIPI